MPGGRRKFLIQPQYVNRLRLYVAGVKLPKLGSIQDSMLQRFMLQETQREVLKNKLVVYQAVAMSTSKDTTQELISIWSDYVALAYGIKSEDNSKMFQDMSMMEEYAKIKDLRPKLRQGKTGKLEVTGIPNS
jgi:hypothetical protein